MNVNLVAFAGRIGSAPEFKTISEKFKTVTFSLAVNKRVKNQAGEYEDKTLWLRCKAYNNTAETVNKYVNKGDMLYVQGSIDIDSWTDKEGKPQSITFIQVDSVQLFPKAKTEGSSLPPSEMATQNQPDLSQPEEDSLPF